MFQFTRPEDSDADLDELVTKAENLVKGLGFRFRTVKLAAGDCSASMARTYDIEIQIPSMNGYKEVSSVSNLPGLSGPPGQHPLPSGSHRQARVPAHPQRLRSCHLRIFPAMVEQNERADGSIVIPRVPAQVHGGHGDHRKEITLHQRAGIRLPFSTLRRQTGSK